MSNGRQQARQPEGWARKAAGRRQRSLDSSKARACHTGSQKKTGYNSLFSSPSDPLSALTRTLDRAGEAFCLRAALRGAPVKGAAAM